MSDAATATVVPVLDARMGELYWATYACGDDSLPQCKNLEAASTPTELVLQLPDVIDVAVGEGWNYVDRTSLAIKQYVPDFQIDAMNLAEMAVELYGKGAATDIAAVELSYVRSEISWKKRQRIRSA